MKKTIEILVDFKWGDYVVLVTDEARRKRMVTVLSVSENGVRYGVMCGTEESFHFTYELIPWDEEGNSVGFQVGGGK